MTDLTIQPLVEDVERDLVSAIVKNIDAQKMSEDQARQLARTFLSYLPIQDKHDLLAKLTTFSKMHVEGKSLFLKYGAPIEDEERKQKLDLMSQHLQNGQIDHAINIAKGGGSNGSGN